MKIEIRNLGVVEQAEIDLKPLTIFVGSNNTGKTWTAYILAAILGRNGWNRYSRAYANDETTATYPPLDTAIQQVLNEGNAKIDLIRFADQYGEKCINDIAHRARRWMRSFMGAERVSFKNLEVHLTLTETKRRFLKQIKTYSLEDELSVGQRREKGLLKVLKESAEPTLYFYTQGNISEKLPLRAVKEFLARNVFRAILENLYPEVYIFPTERTTFIALPFNPAELDKAAREINDDAPETKRKRLAAPVVHFGLHIEDAFQSSQTTRATQARNDPVIRDYTKMAQILEEEILHGSVDFSTPEPETQRDLLFQPVEGIVLEMPIVSSMVKELASLALYLRYLARPGDLLIIDEPEMNLHPEAQVRLTEFLAMLVNAGLHILFTTHSPYMLDHLSNLTTAAKHADKESIKNLFYLQRTEAFIPKEKVSVHLFENGTAKSILDEEGIIHWGTFGDVSNRVAKIYTELL